MKSSLLISFGLLLCCSHHYNPAMSFAPAQPTQTRNRAVFSLYSSNAFNSYNSFITLNKTISASEKQATTITTTTTADDTSTMESRRDLDPLFLWATRSGMEFAPGIQLVEDNQGDWGVTVTQPQEQGTAIMTIPSHVILSSEDLDDTGVREWMEQTLDSKQYVPEWLLIVRVLEEVSKGEASRWYAWLQSLPKSFSTGLYMDEVEKSHVRRMAPRYLEQQDQQWNTCLTTTLSLVYGQGLGVNFEFQSWLLAQENLQETIRWAFSVVFTRSWRTPGGRHATIVPLGDMLNHDSQNANVQPCLRKDTDSLQLCLTENTDVGDTSLHLSYGLSDYPARFLLVFGFCDLSAPYVDAHIDFLTAELIEKWPSLDTAQLVVSTTNGAIAEEVWNVFLFKILQQYDPDQLQHIQEGYDEKDDSVLVDLMMEWEWTIALALKGHVRHILDDTYPPMDVNELDLHNHPRLKMILNYNIFLRDTFQQVLKHVDTVLEQTSDMRKLGVSNQ